MTIKQQLNLILITKITRTIITIFYGKLNEKKILKLAMQSSNPQCKNTNYMNRSIKFEIKKILQKIVQIENVIDVNKYYYYCCCCCCPSWLRHLRESTTPTHAILRHTGAGKFRFTIQNVCITSIGWSKHVPVFHRHAVIYDHPVKIPVPMKCIQNVSIRLIRNSNVYWNNWPKDWKLPSKLAALKDW